jgi:hypothetical protein
MKRFATRHPLLKKTADDVRNGAEFLQPYFLHRRYFGEQPI